MDSDHLLVTARINRRWKERKKEEDEERKNRIKIQSDIKAKQKYMEETDEM